MSLGIRVSPETVFKDPDEELRKPMRYSGNDMGENEEITDVVDGTPTVIPTGDVDDLTAEVVDVSADGKDVNLLLKKGRADVDYLVIVRVDTDGGQKLTQIGQVRVEPAYRTPS